MSQEEYNAKLLKEWEERVEQILAYYEAKRQREEWELDYIPM